jgi:hypothetical protein
MAVRELNGQVGGSVSAGSLLEERERVVVVGDGPGVIASEVEDLGAECVCDSQCGEARAVVACQDIDGELIRYESSMETAYRSCNVGFRTGESRDAKSFCGVGIRDGEVVLHGIDRR